MAVLVMRLARITDFLDEWADEKDELDGREYLF